MPTYGVGPISIAELLKTRDEVSLWIDLVAFDAEAGAGSDAAGHMTSTTAGHGVAGPSFAEEILPILSSACAQCHQPGDVGAGN